MAVILVPGLAFRWGFLKHLGDKISSRGYPVYVVPELGSNLLDISKSAKFVREILEENNLNNVIIVTHSKGGLIGKYLLIHENNDNRIKGVIAVATPFSGTSLGQLLPHPAFRELIAEGKLIKALKLNKSVNSKIVSIYPLFDNHIYPQGGGSYLEEREYTNQCERSS